MVDCRWQGYKLTLTPEERAAFDWVGGRYSCGDEAKGILLNCLPDGVEWEDSETLAFGIPEFRAWELQTTFAKDEEGGHQPFPCFAPELASKLQSFLNEIV